MVFKSGYVSIAGRPNVGKSTLLNEIIGQKIAIVTPKAQTTRNSITGIKTVPDAQIIFIDTPGIHKPLHKLGEIMVKNAFGSLKDVDVVIYVTLPVMPKSFDVDTVRKVMNSSKKCILAINKVDTVKKAILLPVIGKYAEMFSFAEIVPISALSGEGIDALVDTVKKYLPEGPQLYPDDMASDQMEKFLAAEIIREKVFLYTKEEIPHSVTVEVLRWNENDSESVVKVEANIYVERESQKGIIIGSGGSMLKKIGSAARMEIERVFGAQFYLSLWVKTKKDWRENVSFLREIGFK